MKILKEAVLFFALVLVLVVGATLLSKYSPEGSISIPSSESEELFEPETNQSMIPEEPEEREIYFTANLYYNTSNLQINIPATLHDLSFDYESSESPLKIGEQRLSIEGEHTLDIKEFDGPISFLLRSEATIELFGSAKSLLLDALTFDADEPILLQTPKLSVSTLTVSDAEIDHLILKLTAGVVQLNDPLATFDLQNGNSLDIVNFKGKFEFEEVTSRITLTGTASKLTTYSVRNGKSTEIRIS